MKKIDIKGDIIGNDSAWIYDWLEWDYTSPRQIENALNEANGDEVVFMINSGGGSVFDGYEIFNLIKEYSGKTTAKIVGIAASAASFIAMAADKVQASALSQIMIHRAANGNRGNAPSHQANADFLNQVDNTIVKAYTMKNGKSSEEMIDLMDKTTWFTAEEALENGIIDEIVNDKVSKNIVNADCTDKFELVSKLIELGSVDEIKKALLDNATGIKVTDSATLDTKNTENKEEMQMTKDELQAQYSDLCNEIAQDAVTNERKRISDIYALARPGVEDQIKKGVEDGLTAGEVAINILNAQTEKGKKTLENMKKDAENSGLGAVATETPQDTEQDDQKASINLLAEAGKNIMGGAR